MASRDAVRRSPAHSQRSRLGAQRFPMPVCDQSPHRRLKNLMEHFFERWFCQSTRSVVLALRWL
jgi:hypothetical protein